MKLKIILLLYVLAIIFYKSFKRKNYENESINNTLCLLFIAFFPLLIFDKLINNIYFFFIILFLVICINALPEMLKKHTYNLRLFDIEDKESYIKEINEFIETYKIELDEKSEIILFEQRIIFKNVSKSHIYSCLYSIDQILERQKSKFSYKKSFYKDMIKLIIFIVIGITASLLVRLYYNNVFFFELF